MTEVGPSEIVARLREERAGLLADGPAEGRAWCEAWTARVDGALHDLDRASGIAGVTVVATGGYGRRELCPGSDVDVLLLHDGLDEAQLQDAVQAIVYPLWDVGLKVGYAVRSRKEAVSAADDLDTATAMLDARLVAGSAPLLRSVDEAVLKRLQRRPARFLDALTAKDAERRAQAGDAAESLEPDLKNGAGGLRDVQSLRWAAGVLIGKVGLDPLVAGGYLGAPDRSRLARAYDQLLTERVATHLVSERGNDVLRFDLQQEVATRCGFEDGHDDRDTAAHRLLSAHFLAARAVDHVHERAWRLISADATSGRRRRRPAQARIGDFEIVDGVLRVPEIMSIDHPDLPVRLLHALARAGAVLDRRTATRLRNRVAQGEVPWVWDRGTRSQFVSALWRGSQMLTPIAELDDADVVVALLPEWQAVRGRAQRNPFHKYSLDRHAWHAAVALGDLVRDERWAAIALERIDDREALMLGALLHDIGKAFGEPHSSTGIPVARRICEHLGCGEATIDRVATLVELHLLLPDVATRRDLSDAALITKIAEQIGDHATLASLHLLTVADGLATGPSAWTTWKATLVRTLVQKVAAVLDDKHPDEIGDGATDTAEQAQRLAADLGTTAEQVRDHLARLPRRYAATVAPRSVVRHALMAATFPEPGEVRTRVTPGDDRRDGLDAYDELDVVALDAPGLFSKVAGVIALNGGSIMGATGFARDDGAAVDTFTVLKPDGAPLSWWARVEGDLVDAIAGKLALRARLSTRARQEQRKLDRLPDVPTKVSIVEDESGSASVIEVHTQDRAGVLFVITDALAELHLDIVVARIQTLGNEVVDAFTVRDTLGKPLDDDHASEVELAITAAIERLGD